MLVRSAICSTLCHASDMPVRENTQILPVLLVYSFSTIIELEMLEGNSSLLFNFLLMTLNLSFLSCFYSVYHNCFVPASSRSSLLTSKVILLLALAVILTGFIRCHLLLLKQVLLLFFFFNLNVIFLIFLFLQASFILVSVFYTDIYIFRQLSFFTHLVNLNCLSLHFILYLL